MSKYRNDGFYKEMEKELEELEAKEREDAEREEEDREEELKTRPKNTEEKTWKDRYGNLRRFQQDRERELNQRIEALEEKVKTSSKEQIKYPKTEEEVQEWMEKYPDIGAIVQTLAQKEAVKVASKADERFADLEAREARSEYQKQYAILLGEHPDFDEIRVTDDFIDWMQNEDPDFTAPLRQGKNGRAAAKVVKAYKQEKGLDKPRKEGSKNRDTERVTKNRSDPEDSNKGKKIIYESDLEKMTPQQFERMAGEIDLAIAEGRFEYDVSNA